MQEGIAMKLELSREEQQTLRELSLNHRWRDVRCRASSLLLLAMGKRVTEVAAEHRVRTQSVYNWAHAWEGSGLVGLIGKGHVGGRPPLLTEADLEMATAAAAQEALTLAGLAQRIEARRGSKLPCSLFTLGRALKARGLSFKRTRLSLKKNGMKPPLPG
jgi:transposase